MKKASMTVKDVYDKLTNRGANAKIRQSIRDFFLRFREARRTDAGDSVFDYNETKSSTS